MVILKLKSKTHWLGILLGVSSGISAFLPQVQAFMTPAAYGIVLGVFAVLTIIIRNVTETPIDQK